MNTALFKPSVSCLRMNSSGSSFKFADMQYELNKTVPDLPDDPSKLAFGGKFTDHMLTIEWSGKNGWGKPKIGPLKNLELHPAAKCLHYSVEIFEGMKAYKAVDGTTRMFRPDKNMARFHKSAMRSVLPSFDQTELLQCVKKLVSIEKDWIPNSPIASLYIRPTMIGTEPTLGVSASNTALLYAITSPTGPYFPSGFKPITLYADSTYIRAFPGGVGNVKVGSNYGPTIYVAIEAQKKGAQQVLWLFGDKEYLTEAGTMNIFVVIKNDAGDIELITPPLDGTILEGVTRQSILDMTRQWDGIKVSERSITMKDILKLHKKQRLIEMFGAGTACVVCPVDTLLYKNNTFTLPTMSSGAVILSRIAKELGDIQYGRVEHEWSQNCDE